jgi:predicted CXXCH cytochrome family protein
METGNTHDPAAEGACLDCHLPHRSEQVSLLTGEVPGVCLDCHDTEDEDFLAVHLGQSGEGLDCRKCHDPHAAEGEDLIQPLRHDPFAAGACDACHPAPAGQGGQE